MACFLWTTADRPTPKKDKSKRGREWARQAKALGKDNPAQLARDISIYKMSWLSKRHSVYARGARAGWTERQWWVEMKKEDDTRRAGARGRKLGGRSGQG